MGSRLGDAGHFFLGWLLPVNICPVQAAQRIGEAARTNRMPKRADQRLSLHFRYDLLEHNYCWLIHIDRGGLMSRICFAGDWHGDLGWGIASLKSAVETGASLLVQVGDLGADWPGLHKTRFGDRLSLAAERAGIPIAFVRGNHDNTGVLFPLPVEPEGYAKLREHIWYIPDGGRFEHEGIAIGGLGGATSSDRVRRRLEEAKGRGKPRTIYWPEEVVDRHAAIRLALAGPLDVLVTHEMPDGPWVADYNPREGDDASYDRDARMDREIVAIARDRTHPRLHVFGHWHRRRSIMTDSNHVGRYLLEGLGMNGNREGSMIVWDSHKHKATDVEVKWGRKQ